MVTAEMYRCGIRALVPSVFVYVIGNWCQVPPSLVATPLLYVVEEHEPHHAAYSTWTGWPFASWVWLATAVALAAGLLPVVRSKALVQPLSSVVLAYVFVFSQTSAPAATQNLSRYAALSSAANGAVNCGLGSAGAICWIVT